MRWRWWRGEQHQGLAENATAESVTGGDENVSADNDSAADHHHSTTDRIKYNIHNDHNNIRINHSAAHRNIYRNNIADIHRHVPSNRRKSQKEKEKKEENQIPNSRTTVT
jgi:hypothetical protein